MDIHVSKTAEALGQAAGELAAQAIQAAIQQHGRARIILSTGASQFETLTKLVTFPIDWSRVDAFHLDEYVGIASDHPASFRRYLRERFEAQAPGVNMHYVNPDGDIQENLATLSRALCSAPIHVALIGIGENGHIAFNDPPADFNTDAAYIIVNLDEACKLQQVREGWFPSLEAVPRQAITMTPRQILQSERIISAVPHQVKARAVQMALTGPITNQVPASILKSHPDWHLFLDDASAEETFPR